MPISVFTRVKGTGWRKHTCIHCGQRFAYPMTRSEIGMADVGHIGEKILDARQESLEVANRSLQAALRVQFDLVPCVGCGRYQPEMIERMAHQKYRPLEFGLVIAVLIAPAVAICTVGGTFATIRDSVYTPLNLLLLALCWILSFVLSWLAIWVYRTHKRLISSYDPHNGKDPREWIAVARRRGAITDQELFLKQAGPTKERPWA